MFEREIKQLHFTLQSPDGKTSGEQATSGQFGICMPVCFCFEAYVQAKAYIETCRQLRYYICRHVSWQKNLDPKLKDYQLEFSVEYSPLRILIHVLDHGRLARNLHKELVADV